MRSKVAWKTPRQFIPQKGADERRKKRHFFALFAFFCGHACLGVFQAAFALILAAFRLG
jgi:hypothetical protein